MKKLSKDKQFRIRLRTLLEEKLMIKQVEFCKNLGITTGYISMILSGKRGPSADLIAGLYIHYREYMDWLITGTEPVNDPLSIPFLDQPRADKIIGNLSTLESADKEAYARVEGYIDSAVCCVQAKKNATKKTGT